LKKRGGYISTRAQEVLRVTGGKKKSERTVTKLGRDEEARSSKNKTGRGNKSGRKEEPVG